jgi:hypothetical protein
MSGINAGDEVRTRTQIKRTELIDTHQKLVFESSEAIHVVSTFDDLGLKEDLIRGIYAYSSSCLFHRLCAIQ